LNGTTEFERLWFDAFWEVGLQVEPLGKIIAVAHLREIVPITDYAVPSGVLNPARYELEFGDYRPGRFAWEFDKAIRLPEPVPCKGQLGLWRMGDDVKSAVVAQIGEAV
jgi:hypothetical protein